VCVVLVQHDVTFLSIMMLLCMKNVRNSGNRHTYLATLKQHDFWSVVKNVLGEKLSNS